MISALVLLAIQGSSECLQQDAARIQKHLFETEAALRANPPAGLSDEQMSARLRNLDHLHEYAVRDVVPVNDRFSRPEPFFIDAVGTRCAMAALIEQEGGAALVQRIARERNNARVHELVDEPELVAWLERNGMTADEAARVQPSYWFCGPSRQYAVCVEADNAVEVTSVSSDDAGLHCTVDRVLRLDGGWSTGDELLIERGRNDGHALGPLDAVLSPGQRLFLHAKGGRVINVSPIASDAGIFFYADRRCSDHPSIGWDDATRWMGLRYEVCAANCSVQTS